MKALFSTVVLWTGIFLTLAQAQDINTRLDTYQQNINVFNKNELTVIVSGPNVHEIKESGQWRNLLNSFLKNLESIKDQIPEYLIYKIEYQKDFNLVVEEVEGIVKYKVENGQTNFAPNQSRAVLNDEDYFIEINFGELNDLFSNDYEAMIESAMANLGRKPGGIERSYAPKYNYDYSFSKKEMLEPRKEREISFVIPINGTIGLFRGKPIYETGGGLGISIKEKNSGKYSTIYIFASTVFQYNDESQKMETDLLSGIAIKFRRTGTLSFAFPSSDAGGIYEGVDLRFGTTFHSKKAIDFSVFWNVGFDDDLSDSFPSAAFGFSF